MRLRWQLVVSHVVTVSLAAVLIAAAYLALLVRSTRALEQQSLESAVATAGRLLLQKVGDLDRARNELARFAAARPALREDLRTLARVHDLMALYSVERVEIFGRERREFAAYRWQRGADRRLETLWFPANPALAAKVASGLPVTWVQRGTGGPPSLKLCASLPAVAGEDRRWIVITEPLDGLLVERVLAPQLIGAVEDDSGILATWPEPERSAVPRLADLQRYLHGASFGWLLGPLLARSPVLRLDDGSALNIVAMAEPFRSGRSLRSGLQAWLLVVLACVVLAFAVGTGLGRRLLAPLTALLEGTAAIARGHLMIRLPAGRNDELGALTREFNRMADEIRNAYVGAISTLAEVVEAKSQYTREHIERVEALVLATADVLERRGWVRFSSHQRFLLSVAAILHDVGKIAIGNEILNKSGPLTSAERQQILTHPEVGAVIVERIGKLERAAEIIRCAHEHFDGSGYPRGLRGEEIPIESRIILAVDAYDAMAMSRPYSVGRTEDDVIAELRQEAGRQFDPVVVEALIEVVRGQREPNPRVASDSGLYRTIHAVTEPDLTSTRRSPGGRG